MCFLFEPLISLLSPATYDQGSMAVSSMLQMPATTVWALGLLLAAASLVGCVNQNCACEHPAIRCFTPTNETVCGIQHAVCGVQGDVAGYDSAISNILSQQQPNSSCYHGLRALYCSIYFPTCDGDETYAQVCYSSCVKALLPCYQYEPMIPKAKCTNLARFRTGLFLPVAAQNDTNCVALP